MHKNNLSLTDQLKQLKHGQQLLAMAILLLVVVFFWIFLTIFTDREKTTITASQKKASTALTPNIDESTLTRLENKYYYDSAELADFPIYKFVTIENGTEAVVIPISASSEEVLSTPQPATESSEPESL